MGVIFKWQKHHQRERLSCHVHLSKGPPNIAPFCIPSGNRTQLWTPTSLICKSTKYISGQCSYEILSKSINKQTKRIAFNPIKVPFQILKSSVSLLLNYQMTETQTYSLPWGKLSPSEPLVVDGFDLHGASAFLRSARRFKHGDIQPIDMNHGFDIISHVYSRRLVLRIIFGKNMCSQVAGRLVLSTGQNMGTQNKNQVLRQ